jgi:hypothetical protein
MVPTARAAAGVARFVEPYTVIDGQYSFQLFQLTKSGFVYESAKNVQTFAAHSGYGGAGDADGDAVVDGSDNCITVANASQTDTDGDLLGDACDDCPAVFDPAQKDQDGDGTGDRCECAPYDALRTGLTEAAHVRFEDKTTLAWDGVSGADRYDISSGAIPSLNGSDYGACIREDHASTSFVTGDPLPGQTLFFIVWPDDAVCGQGPGGDSSTGPRVNANASACVS